MKERNTIYIPLEFAQHVFNMGLSMRKALRIFLYLKLNEHSKIKDIETALTNAEPIVGLKYRTIRKHFDRLIAEKWIGTDEHGYYYLRSFRYIRRSYDFTNRRAVQVHNEDLKNMEEFLVAALITNSNVNQETTRYIYLNKRKKSRVFLKKRNAAQRDPFLTEINYCGMSSSTLGSKLGLSRTQAQRLLKSAEKCGYLKLIPQKRLVKANCTSSEIACMKESGEFDNHKLFVEGSYDFKWNLYERLHNEVISYLDFKVKKDWKEDRNMSFSCF